MNKWLKLNYSLYLGSFLIAFLLFFVIFGPYIAPHSITDTVETVYDNGQIIAPPIKPFVNKEYPLGTDIWGYDLTSMVILGLRYTFVIALLITIMKMVLGTIAGLYAGTWKRTPGWIVAFENAWSYVPSFIILYFFLRPITFNSSLQPNQLITYFIILTSVISVPSILSSVRKKTAELNKSAYIEASRTLGSRRNRIIWKHIYPQLKESLIIMFLLEFVQVITVMGQLALMNIFIGGTIMRTDPVIYLSVTKELAGLVGGARSNVYSTWYVLAVPLLILLLITVTFSLLANGMKNRYQADYQRTPWIKTGFEPVITPIRVRKGLMTGELYYFSILFLVFIFSSIFVIMNR